LGAFINPTRLNTLFGLWLHCTHFGNRPPRFFTRFAHMDRVFPSRRWRSPRVWRGACWCLAGSFVLLASALAPGQAPSSKSRSTAKGKDAAAASKTAAPAEASAPAPDATATSEAESSQTRKVAPNEVFKDPKAEALLDVSKFRQLPAVTVSNADILSVQEMAGNVNATIDRTLVERVVTGLTAKLTNHQYIQALIEPPPKVSDEVSRGIQDATTNLLQPLFLAQSAKNQAFLTVYQRALISRLPQLLNNHLIPRVQAMIILGECGSPDALAIYERAISDPNQTLWVKLWALEGIANIPQKGGRLSVDAESKAAKLISDFLLDRSDELPWPIVQRGLQALGALRQAFLPTAPRKADMANAAMQFLADGDAKPEVRAEAARALGLMQITTAVPRFNFALVAHAAGQLAADVAAAIDATYSENPPRADNPTKARYLTALLIGPVYEAFDGVSEQRDSGLLHSLAAQGGPTTAYVQKVFDLVKQIAQSSVQLLGAPSKEFKERKKTLAGQVTALRTFLEKNPPPNRQLVQDGKEFPAGGPAAGVWQTPPASPLAGSARPR
jgi:hypothetical protein